MSDSRKHWTSHPAFIVNSALAAFVAVAGIIVAIAPDQKETKHVEVKSQTAQNEYANNMKNLAGQAAIAIVTAPAAQ
jgi:hypothetical protein